MKTKGQTLLEYILLIGVVTMALIYMGTDIKRAFQRLIKVTADQLGNQAESEQETDWRLQKGVLQSSNSQTSQKTWKAKQYTLGVEKIIDSETVQSSTKTVSNLGYTSE